MSDWPWSGKPLPSPRDLPHPGTGPGPPAWQADSLPAEQPGKPSKEVGAVSKCQDDSDLTSYVDNHFLKKHY